MSQCLIKKMSIQFYPVSRYWRHFLCLCLVLCCHVCTLAMPLNQNTFIERCNDTFCSLNWIQLFHYINLVAWLLNDMDECKEQKVGEDVGQNTFYNIGPFLRTGRLFGTCWWSWTSGCTRPWSVSAPSASFAPPCSSTSTLDIRIEGIRPPGWSYQTQFPHILHIFVRFSHIFFTNLQKIDPTKFI
jgi:hypothetical protein